MKIENKTGVTLQELMPIIHERIGAGQSIRFFPHGVSMLPMLRPGVDSVVISAPPKTLRKYAIPLYRREDGSYALHRVVRVGEMYTCMGDNQYAPESVKKEQVIAVVSAFYRGEKMYKTTNIGYCLYCRLWYWIRCGRKLWHRGKRWLKRMIIR